MGIELRTIFIAIHVVVPEFPLAELLLGCNGGYRVAFESNLVSHPPDTRPWQR
jgi:hypothetical protein